ncbi:MAG TPA: CapA family protein [candidate division Zixibacteria bacterium]|nr:CapA family protein [candidate division Zixibacteria bacterium]
MLYEPESGNIKIALLGDVMPTRRLSVFREERYLELREVLTGADATFANLESCVHEYLEGHHGISGGTYMTTEPHLLEDLKWLGIDFVSCANNHAFDYGEEGILATIRYLDAAGLPHAGTGRNLREARSPAYLDTARGRVALIAATATFPPPAVAGEQRPDVPGRPGVNPLRHSTAYLVDRRGLEDLRRLGALLGFDAARERRRSLGDAQAALGADGESEYDFGGMRFERSETFGIRTTGNKRDIEENLQQIKEARRMADWVVVSLHCHELGGEKLATARLRSEIEELADFAVEFAHRCIDAGADIFVGHGPQEPFGIEIYRGRPIFYSLGSTIFQLETPRFLAEEAYARYGLGPDSGPADFADTRYRNDTVGHPSDPAYWRQVAATCEFRGGKLLQVDLHPLDLGFGKPRWQRGRPVLADPELGEKIIARVARLSQKFGTEVRWQDGRGVIVIR